MAYIPDAPALVAGPARPSGDNRPSWTEAAATDGPVHYDTQVYARTARFDHAGRGIALTLPRDLTWGDPTGAPPAIGGVLHFNNRGLPARASATIDCDPVTSATACAETPIVSSIAYTRDGLPHEVQWGDAHGAHDATVSTTTYDVRRRPVRMRTLREPTDTTLQSLGAVTEVVHQELVWDVASNLTATIDHRPGDEWAPGHLPQSTIVTHDALYRVIGASFSYSHDDGHRSDEDDPGDTGLDTIDWRATQAAIREAGADPMESTPAPMVPTEPDARVRDIAWSWDWLGNTTSWTDDASSFYERSIGAIENGIDVGPSLRPSALYFSTNIPASGAGSLPAGQAGWLELEYGEGGNVTTMTVHGQCANAPAATCDAPTASSPTARAADMRASCACATEQHYEYRWDELNRLSEARRWDRTSGGPWGIEVRQRYRYDASNVRTVKQTFEPTAETQAGTAGALGERIALYVYPGDFEVRGLQRGGSEYEDLGGHVEAQYVVAGARLVWQFDEGTAGFSPGTRARHQRFTVPLTDIIQTTAATLDVLSGELVEAGTYYPNGATESLQADAEDASALEPNGFTSKEGDEEVGLAYFGERYLISRLGCWASPDPLSIHAAAGGEALNSYHYVRGNMFQVRDPLGLAPGDPDTVIFQFDQEGERSLRISEPAEGGVMTFSDVDPPRSPPRSGSGRLSPESRMPIAPWQGGIQDGSGYRGGDRGAAAGVMLFNALRGFFPSADDTLAAASTFAFRSRRGPRMRGGLSGRLDSVGMGIVPQSRSSRGVREFPPRRPPPPEWRPGARDHVWRGGSRGGDWRGALEEAFRRTGVPRRLFSVSRWGRTVNGKSIPVQWEGPGGAQVNLDFAHGAQSGAPNVPHVGWNTPRTDTQDSATFHITLDDVPAGRPPADSPEGR